MSNQHNYSVTITWTGNREAGTTDYQSYDRHFTLSIANKEPLQCSADTIFRGDGTKYNPEDMIVASLSSCHMLWYLHMCADAGVVVTDYTDNARGTLVMIPETGGHFSEAVLRPIVTVADASMIDRANELHEAAHKKCFISNSVNFPITIEAKAVVKE